MKAKIVVLPHLVFTTIDSVDFAAMKAKTDVFARTHPLMNPKTWFRRRNEGEDSCLRAVRNDGETRVIRHRAAMKAKTVVFAHRDRDAVTAERERLPQ